MAFPVIRIPGITELPIAGAGMRIGLFGGSFNPPHEGHRLVALQALKRLQLDAVWIMVSPGNPLKTHTDLAPLAERVAATRALMAHPKLKVTGFEAAHGFRYSYDTLRFLLTGLPQVHFVWIMGADNLLHFHQWERWRDIAAMLPMAIYVRPGAGRRALTSIAGQALARYRLDETDAELLATSPAPAWIYLNGTTSPLSSSAIRARAKAPGKAGKV